MIRYGLWSCILLAAASMGCAVQADSAPSSEVPSSDEQGIGAQTPSSVDAVSSCGIKQTSGAVAHPKIDMTLRAEPRIGSTEYCGSIFAGSSYFANCYVLGEWHKGSNHWLWVSGASGVSGYAPFANFDQVYLGGRCLEAVSGDNATSASDSAP